MSTKILSFHVRIYNWILPEHIVYIYIYNILWWIYEYLTLPNLIAISSNSICEGITSCRAESLLKHYTESL